MNATQFRQLIKEAIADRLKMIDEAGDKAAVHAKIAKIEEDIEAANKIKSSLPVDEIRNYVDPEIIGDFMEDLNKSIAEFEAKKKELEEQIKEMEKPVKEGKKKPSAGMTGKEKSTVIKKAKSGEDIGKKGKGFQKVAKAAEKEYGSKEAGKKVAAAAMWKQAAKY